MIEEQKALSPSDMQFVPTLTEVAGPEEPSVDLLAIAEVAPAPPVADADPDLAGQVLAMLQPDLERRIAEAISHALHEQMQGLHARVQQAVTSEVRRAVTQALHPSESEADLGT